LPSGFRFPAFPLSALPFMRQLHIFSHGRIYPDNRRMNHKLFLKLKGWTRLDEAGRVARRRGGVCRAATNFARAAGTLWHGPPKAPTDKCLELEASLVLGCWTLGAFHDFAFVIFHVFDFHPTPIPKKRTLPGNGK
jgi:hypothetical protein